MSSSFLGRQVRTLCTGSRGFGSFPKQWWTLRWTWGQQWLSASTKAGCDWEGAMATCSGLSWRQQSSADSVTPLSLTCMRFSIEGFLLLTGIQTPVMVSIPSNTSREGFGGKRLFFKTRFTFSLPVTHYQQSCPCKSCPIPTSIRVSAHPWTETQMYVSCKYETVSQKQQLNNLLAMFFWENGT